MKDRLFFKNITKNKVYTFTSLQEDYDMTSKEAFAVLTVFVKNKLVVENDGSFQVVADEDKLREFKETSCEFPEIKAFFEKSDDELKSEKDEDIDEDDSEEDSIWTHFFEYSGLDFGDDDEDDDSDTENEESEGNLRKPRFGEDFGDDEDEFTFFDVDEGKTKSFECLAEDLKELEKDGYFAPMPDDLTLYVNVYAYDDAVKKMKIDIRHSFKHFLENVENQEPELLKAFFVTDLDYKLYLSDKKHLDLVNSHIVFGDSLVDLCHVDFKKPIIKQRYLYSLIASSKVLDEDYYLFAKLRCKKS